jgi:hypothetical protein
MAASSGSAQLRAISLRLKAAGAGAYFNPIRAEIRSVARPLAEAAQAAARERLPRGGGLNEWVASQRITISVSTGQRTAGVRLQGPRRRRSGGQTNKGYVRHPVYGHIGRWAKEDQQIPGADGWWSDTLRERSAAVTPRIVAVINRVSRWVQSAGL